ncbi:urea carboxylase [Sulfobacillus thermosulfidooxidans]|uniref:urea carboxylase n=1 Tax=Sulfobacillus thermosulfidooxidans TaxID=28034 RepID=UPI00096BBDE5|nr:urea carboxylase [Sulfobacillus thermosulfidooxidans]OLZ11070.1 urea carboxylase [Sulfobacillus thermosulfidooxidans]OLZ13489.1 urea carboxylase [Sulfobacillus thermosulfidooxidans]OLZ20754.1 urea carboxylase [Sulfobacillus thermosulfidooxidans]
MFNKVLIANRGAIAVRIARTLKNMGIASVAVYTSADQDSLHVDVADEAVCIGEGPAPESYLNARVILDTALAMGVDAVHPGYGFLSENAEFAQQCLEKGIAFIGPSPEHIAMFGQKHTARAIAEQAGVPIVPGSGLLENLDQALEVASGIGYPVMLKATAGGGGIGMQICQDPDALTRAFESVTRVAALHFHNGGVFVEKYIPQARHIEVQIFGQATGEIVTLGERDCSLQRRNQKVVEETPAPGLTFEVRARMEQAAKRLAEIVHYRNAGTVEFIYDVDSTQFYFLEVNTRLQVEHGITEEIFGIDLVEWQVKEAAGDFIDGFSDTLQPQGHSLEVRIYAEDPGNQFRPSTGLIDTVEFPDFARVDTWVRPGIVISPYYDSMLAKIIVHGPTRDEALRKMRAALDHTRFYGVATNRHYLRSLFEQPAVIEGTVFTQFLADFNPAEPALEVLDPGLQTTVQDWPGRLGYWQVGVPPSGPMDALSFRLGNLLLGNEEGAPGLEMTLRGGSYRFRDDIWFCITGAPMNPRLDGEPIPLYHPMMAKRGQVLQLDEAECGMRTYLTVAGGLDIPKTLGSGSTFTLGGFGGHSGRALQVGDVLRVCREAPIKPFCGTLPSTKQPAMSHHWTIGVIPGPHCSTEFLQPSYLPLLVQTTWEVHFNSSRTGVRLIGPPPPWARQDGGDAGLHPSNIHDNAYAVGTLDLTGDMPILLGPDGPSLGGFVCPVTTATAELWKIGQLRPGDTISFRLLTIEEAEQCLTQQEDFLQHLEEDMRALSACLFAESGQLANTPNYPLLYQNSRSSPFAMTIRADGDQALLVEYGPMELDLRLRFQVHALMTALQNIDELPIIDLTPGIRSLHIHFDPRRMTLQKMTDIVRQVNDHLPPLESISVPSRIVRLPLSWDDPATQLAIKRYQQNVRPDAPWCPSNLEFIRRINGLDAIDDVKDIVFSATYLVLGLGDVYLGAPVATPIDPRHRLITTKYNPARTWTPENAVGIGGAYLCVYGMEGPGGYQFVGRTVQMWNKWRTTKSFQPGRPWLLRFFDQIQFYPVSAEELLQLRQDFLRGRFEVDIQETVFDLGSYLRELDHIQTSVENFRRRQQQSFQAERERWRALGVAEYVSADTAALSQETEHVVLGTVVPSTLPGSVWKVLVQVGDEVTDAQTLVVLESMKMEFAIVAPKSGVVAAIYVKPGDQVRPGQWLIDLVDPE